MVQHLPLKKIATYPSISPILKWKSITASTCNTKRHYPTYVPELGIEDMTLKEISQLLQNKVSIMI